MTYPTITTLPTPPSRSEPSTFADRAGAFVNALPTFGNELNTAGDYIETKAGEVDADATAASASAQIAVGAANYQGDYNSGTTYAVGESVSYSGSQFVAKTVNTGVTPVDGANWLEITAGTLQTASTSGASQTIDFSTTDIHVSTANATTVTFTFSNPSTVDKIDLVIVPTDYTSYDLSTALYVQNFDVSAQETGPQGVFFKPDGTKMYIVGSSGDDVNEYNLSSAWDISSASYSQNFDVSAQDITPTGVFFKPDGTKMYIVGSFGDAVYEYNLSSAWDISSASYSQNFDVSAQDTGPSGVFFKPDGTKMYIVGAIGDAVYEYYTGGVATLVFPDTMETPTITLAAFKKTALTIVTTDGGTSYQVISVQGDIK